MLKDFLNGAGIVLAIVVVFTLLTVLYIDALEYEATGDCEQCILLPCLSPSL